MKRILSFLTAFSFFLALAACTNNPDGEATGEGKAVTGGDQTVETAVQEGPEYTSAYLCPMHCKGSGSDQPGQCPACGMDYVARAELQKRDHGHDHGHGHDHQH